MQQVGCWCLAMAASAIVIFLKARKFVRGPPAQVEDIGEPLLVFRGLFGKRLEERKVVNFGVGVSEESPACGDMRVPSSASNGFHFEFEVLPGVVTDGERWFVVGMDAQIRAERSGAHVKCKKQKAEGASRFASPLEGCSAIGAWRRGRREVAEGGLVVGGAIKVPRLVSVVDVVNGIVVVVVFDLHAPQHTCPTLEDVYRRVEVIAVGRQVEGEFDRFVVGVWPNDLGDGTAQTLEGAFTHRG